MKILLIAILCVGAPCTLSAEDPQLTDLMKTMSASYTILRQPDVMSNEKAERSAERLGTSYEDLIEYWRQQKIAKAVDLSESGKAASVQLADALHSHDAQKTAELVKAVGATCHSCHEAYREKLSNGSYRIKPETPSNAGPRSSPPRS